MKDLKVLFIIVSGPEEVERARQGLRIARNMAREKMAEVKMLFIGPGVYLLDPQNPHYKMVKDYLTALNEAGAYVAACAGNLKAYNLYEKIDRNLVIADDSTSVVAEAAGKGYSVISF
ncbi:MAG: DsrE family protein [Candidatus Caldarchaeum sp.]